jgi:hypothetical protein
MKITKSSWHLKIDILDFAWVKLWGTKVFLDIKENVDDEEFFNDVEE